MKAIHATLAVLTVVAAALFGAFAEARFLANDPVPFDPTKPAQFNRYAYGYNDPINTIDRDGRLASPAMDRATTAFMNPEAAALTLAVEADVGYQVGAAIANALPGSGLVGAAQNLSNGNIGAAIVDVASEHPAGKLGKAFKAGNLPKPPRGRGSVPKDQRDPQRAFSPKQQQEMVNRQGGQCANGCGRNINVSNSDGHHVKRHADGGATTTENGAQVCKDCHKELHSPD